MTSCLSLHVKCMKSLPYAYAYELWRLKKKKTYHLIYPVTNEEKKVKRSKKLTI